MPDVGDGLYRRSMYTFWKRTSPPPGMTSFDAPDRETCVIRRSRTNTPLQALVLLNDPTYLEAARKLAERVLIAEKTDDARLELAFKLVVTRDPDDAERRVLTNFLVEARRNFHTNPAAATQLLNIGHTKSDSTLDPATLAAWTTLTSLLLNLDEAITKT